MIQINLVRYENEPIGLVMRFVRLANGIASSLEILKHFFEQLFPVLFDRVDTFADQNALSPGGSLRCKAIRNNMNDTVHRMTSEEQFLQCFVARFG
jgi:hypothetical protein